MSSTIDWSKAPEGATHYVEGSGAPWEKRDGDVWYFFRERYHDWVRLSGVDMHGDRRIEVSKLTIIERPTSDPTPWQGEGLPPVGTVCEFHGLYPKDDEWHKDLEPGTQVTVIAHYDNAGTLVAAFTFGQPGINMAVDCAVEGWFRPIKSAEQIAAEERIDAVNKMCRQFMLVSQPEVPWRDLFNQMYDAGYRKVEQP